MSNMNRYLVVVHSPKSKVRDAGTSMGTSAYTVASPPSARWITASSPQAAAQEASVPPGGYAEVAEETHVRHFDRPEVAILEERMTDGQHLPMAAEVIR